VNKSDRTIVHKIFRILKPLLPCPIARALRSLFTIILQPIYTGIMSGFVLSAILNKAVTAKGNALPWYTYPAISFLSSRQFLGKTVLEFGAGQSTFWWANRAEKVVSFEEDESWYKHILEKKPSNAVLFFSPLSSREHFVAQVCQDLNNTGIKKFDVIAVDGCFREDAVRLALEYLSPDGALIVDDAEGYGIYDFFKETDFQRIDFFGGKPGVLLSNVTSIFFLKTCFLLNPTEMMPMNFA